MKPVLADEFTKDIEYENVYVANVENVKASLTLRILSDKFPIPSLKHLKRLKRVGDGKENRLEIILCRVNDVDSPGVLEQALSKFDLQLIPFVTKVPKNPAFQREQFIEGNKLWPVIFHDIYKPIILDDNEMKSAIQHMRLAIQTAHEALALRELPVGAVIVDPKTNRVLAVAGDSRSGHPLHHATMQCISLVALEEKKRRTHESKSRMKDGAYLCTGYDLYVTREPCVMCAMALVHSRIRRVFYAERNVEFGGLGSVYKIHVQPHLNHHYDVFEDFLRDELDVVSQHTE